MIRFNNVSKVYDNGHRALNNVNLTVDDGEFVFIVGPSGAGKSTLLKLLMNEERPTEGEIYLGKFALHDLPRRKIPALRRSIGIMFQDFRLIDDMTAAENIAYPLKIIGVSKRSIKKRVKYILKLMQLESKAECYPDELSGGEKQRIALGRALVNNPNTIIADEPTGNVDPEMSRQIMGLLKEINDRGTTILVVTHEKNLVNALKKRVIFIDHGKVVGDVMEGTYHV